MTASIVTDDISIQTDDFKRLNGSLKDLPNALNAFPGHEFYYTKDFVLYGAPVAVGRPTLIGLCAVCSIHICSTGAGRRTRSALGIAPLSRRTTTR